MPMTTLSPDTSPEAERVWIEGLRRLTPAQRLARAMQMRVWLDEMQAADVRRRHPQASDREVRLRVASRRLGADLMRRVFGWDPDVEGY